MVMGRTTISLSFLFLALSAQLLGCSGECECNDDSCNSACVAAEYPSGACSGGECLCIRRASEPPPDGAPEKSFGQRLSKLLNLGDETTKSLAQVARCDR